MSDVKWLVENFSNDNKIWKLVEELKRRNQTIEIVNYYDYYLNNSVVDNNGLSTKSSFKKDDCVVVVGSIQLVMWIKRNKHWVPGVWLEPEKFKCTDYYSYLGEFLFNQDYEFTTAAEYKRRFEHFFRRYSVDDCVFIRPNSGLKSFTGQIFKKETHSIDWNYFDITVSNSDIIVITSPKIIKGEWRFIVGGGKIIASSMYQKNGKTFQVPGAPKKAYELVEKIVLKADKNLNLPVYTVDVCENSEGEFFLMEINSFSSSGLYECDKKAVVDAVNEIALKEWIEYQKII